MREWTLTLPSELPLWELESQWTSEFLESNHRGQNPSDWKVSYIIENLLKLKCLKSVRTTHLDTSNRSYGQKKGRESNWQFDSRPLKVNNYSNFLVFRWHATYCWKALNEGYNFPLDFILIVGFHTKIWASKIPKVSTLEILTLPLGSPKIKWHLGIGLMAKHKVYCKGQGGGFTQVWVVVSFVSSCLHVAHVCTKVLQLRTNQLVV